MTIAIIIPARYGSTRFPGKPLVNIAGRSMLRRVIDVARKAASGLDNIEIVVATEDQHIADHAEEADVRGIITSDTCRTGSDRVLEAARLLDTQPDIVINLQGDAPMTPPHFVRAVIDALTHENIGVATPVYRLSWARLDALRDNKKTIPFTGTTAIIDEDGYARWFSKQIIPAIRKENNLRMSERFSPVYQHIGLYGYSLEALEKFCALNEGVYEKLEGLEQLRMLENGMLIKAVEVEVSEGTLLSGIDSPEDIKRAEAYFEKK